MLEPEHNEFIHNTSVPPAMDDKKAHDGVPIKSIQDLLKSLENTVSQKPSSDCAFGDLPLPFAINDVIAEKYQIMDLVSHGSMGLVYRARQISLNRTVAVKVLLPDKPLDPISKKRFQREAYIVAALSHPNIVAVHDSGVLPNGMLYLIMEYLEGQTLTDILEKSHKLDFKTAMPLFMQICSALEYAHNEDVIHRDLKPSNIMLVKNHDGTLLTKVIDFSIAKFTKPKPDQKTITRPGDVFGSPLYMSPEQCQAKVLDHRSDIYSLGCVMYEVLSGAPPLMGDNAMATIYMHVHKWPTPISELIKDKSVPDLLEGIVFKALEKQPEDRFQSAKELLQSLEFFWKEYEKMNQPNWLQHIGKLFS